MLIAYIILWILYISFAILYTSAEPQKKVVFQPWSLLAQPSKDDDLPPACTIDSDCPYHHVCLGGSCVRKLLRGTRCNPETGQWIPFQIQNAILAVCSCLDNRVFSQRLFGGDCDVNVACGVHGTYDILQKKCTCEPGYRAVDLDCVRVPVLEQQAEPCDPVDEIKVSDIVDTFHVNYLSRLESSKAKCVKRPCSFDAFSGRPLKHGKFEEYWGCVCDPSYGLFGVVLDEGNANKHYLSSEGFDACASIFTKDPPKPIDVKWATYFYLGKREPASVILFEGLDDKDLVPLLRGQHGQFMLRQSPWRFDFAQHFFKTHKTFRARTRVADTVTFDFILVGGYGKYNIRNHVYLNDHKPEYCKELGRIQREVPSTESTVYKLLYSSPVCYVEDKDATADPMFWDRFILNPQQFHVKIYRELDRFNAFILSFDSDAMRWTLDMGHSYDIDKFLIIDTNAPEYYK